MAGHSVPLLAFSRHYPATRCRSRWTPRPARSPCTPTSTTNVDPAATTCTSGPPTTAVPYSVTASRPWLSPSSTSTTPRRGFDVAAAPCDCLVAPPARVRWWPRRAPSTPTPTPASSTRRRRASTTTRAVAFEWTSTTATSRSSALRPRSSTSTAGRSALWPPTGCTPRTSIRLAGARVGGSRVRRSGVSGGESRRARGERE